MRKILTTTAILFALLFPGSALAVGKPVVQDVKTLSTVLSAVTLNSSAAARTFTVSGLGGGYAQLNFWVAFTHANNGTLTFTCTAGPATTDNLYVPTVCDSVSSGTCTMAFAGVQTTPSLTTDKKFWVRLGTLGARDVRCTVAHGGSPAAGDIITVKADLTSQ